MKNRKKIIFNGVFLAVVFALTIYGVFHGEDLSSMYEKREDFHSGVNGDPDDRDDYL